MFLHSCKESREIKFGALLDRLPSDNDNTWLATGKCIVDWFSAWSWTVAGHYALKGWSSGCRPKLLRPVDHLKDQTYFLSAISEAGLRRALFPIGHLRKPEVRDLAKQHGLTTAERPDSVGICFVGEKARFNTFLCAFLASFEWTCLLIIIFQHRILNLNLGSSSTSSQAKKSASTRGSGISLLAKTPAYQACLRNFSSCLKI